MCSISVLEFFIESINIDEFKGKRVLEVGSKYVNGSVRPLIEKFCEPKEYVGIDLEQGKFVDIVLSAERLVEYFGEESFDVVISTEVLEHVKDWRQVINNIKRVTKHDGWIYITTRSFGFPYHAYPHDYWRYELNDLRKIFSDFIIIDLKNDPIAPGVFMKAKKPKKWNPKNLSQISLYSVILGKRTTEIVDISKALIYRRIYFKYKDKIKLIIPPILTKVLGKILVI